MNWVQRAAAGVDAKHFQEALKTKARTERDRTGASMAARFTLPCFPSLAQSAATMLVRQRGLHNSLSKPH
jgi:hypothetical protein